MNKQKNKPHSSGKTQRPSRKIAEETEYIDNTPQRKQFGPLPQAWREDIRQALEVMQRGGIILYPTDTIWGIGCDATNAEAVARVFAIKRREDAKALISLVDSPAKIQGCVREMPDVAWDLIELATRPLTIIYDGAQFLAPNLMAEDGSAALRVTNEPFSHELCRRFKRAVVSTSANFSGEASPACFDDINPDLLALVDYVVRSRRDEKAPARPSSVVKLGADGTVKILRE